MRVREDNRNLVLLAAVTLVCAFIALAAAAFDPSASTAQTASKQAALADQTPVRVVGVPFVPNTNPREHR
jgi:acid phosphatase class B